MKNRLSRIAVLSMLLITGLAGCTRKSPGQIEWSVDRGAQTVGNFTVTIIGDNSAGPSLRITHRSEPERVLWESIPGTAFITAARGQADIREHGLPDGSFDVRDQILKRCDRQNVTAIKMQDSSLILGGILSGKGCEVAYNMSLESEVGNQLRFQVRPPHYVSSLRRSLFLENKEYSVFDLKDNNSVQISIFSNVVSGRILYGRTPFELIEEYTAYAGRMRPLPDWIQEGAIISVQGGTERAKEVLNELIRADVPLAGFWIQDWPGKRVTSVGSQLWWDLKLDESLYPRWHDLVGDLAKQKARMLIYVNPFLTNTPGHDELFNEANSAGYLVKKKDGTPYLIKNTDFYAGLIDLSNPGAREWIKGVIKNEMINHAEASGWMTDFGEALPFDAQLYDNADPAVWHNRYPEEWARVNTV